MVSREQELVKKVTELLRKHRGKDNAITARDLAEAIGVKEGDTFVRTRSVIDKAIREYGLPVGANNRRPPGYFYIMNQDELFEYMGTLESRKMQIEDKKQIVFR